MLHICNTNDKEIFACWLGNDWAFQKPRTMQKTTVFWTLRFKYREWGGGWCWGDVAEQWKYVRSSTVLTYVVVIHSKEYLSNNNQYRDFTDIFDRTHGFIWHLSISVSIENIETSTKLFHSWFNAKTKPRQIIFSDGLKNVVMIKMLNICCINVPNYLAYGNTKNHSSTMYWNKKCHWTSFQYELKFDQWWTNDIVNVTP